MSGCLLLRQFPPTAPLDKVRPTPLRVPDPEIRGASLSMAMFNRVYQRLVQRRAEKREILGITQGLRVVPPTEKTLRRHNGACPPAPVLWESVSTTLSFPNWAPLDTGPSWVAFFTGPWSGQVLQVEGPESGTTHRNVFVERSSSLFEELSKPWCALTSPLASCLCLARQPRYGGQWVLITGGVVIHSPAT